MTLLAVLGVSQAYGNNNTYYSRLTVSVGSGEGTVYIGTQGTITATQNANNDNTHEYNITAVAADGYVFDSWEAGDYTNISNTGNANTTATVTSNSENQNNPTAGTAIANFVRQYTYYSQLTGTADPSGGGTVYIDDTAGSNTKNTKSTAASDTHSYTIRAVPAAGYSFVSWSGSGVTISNTSNAETTASITTSSQTSGSPATGTITATFARSYNYYAKVNTTVSPSGGGSITGDTSTKSAISTGASANITFSLTATPNTDYAFLGWSTSADEGDIFDTSASHSFTITATSTTQSSPTSESYYALFKLQVATPVITIDNGNVTITCTTDGATIYYTTDGSDPTTSSTVYSGTFTVPSGTNVKAIAVKSGCTDSGIASQTYTATDPTGVSGGVVTLNDYEDHTWTYYAGVDASVDGGNYNTNYDGTLYSPNPRNVKITYDGNGGAVSID